MCFLVATDPPLSIYIFYLIVSAVVVGAVEKVTLRDTGRALVVVLLTTEPTATTTTTTTARNVDPKASTVTTYFLFYFIYLLAPILFNIQ